MTNSRICFFAATFDYGNRVGLLAYLPGPDGERAAIAAPVALTMVPHTPGDTDVEGTLELDMKAAQSLIEALWQVGLRPSALKSDPHPEVIRRMGAHLEDMRTIAFAKLELGAPREPSPGELAESLRRAR